MGLIDLILNLAAVSLWFSWRSLHFDPLVRPVPVTLVGTLRRAEPRRWRGWQLLAGLGLLLVARSALFWALASPVDWTPKLHLGLIVLAFRSDVFRAALTFSLLSFLRLWLACYFWLLVLAVIDRRVLEPDPLLKLLRLHLGRLTRWSWPVQLLLPLAVVTGHWLVLNPVLVHLGVTTRPQSLVHLCAQGFLVSLGLVVSLKYLLPALLLLHWISSYVYFGSNPFWDFIATTAQNVLAPLRRIPLRLGRVDFAPLVGVGLTLLLLHWLPLWTVELLARRNLTLWPQ